MGKVYTHFQTKTVQKPHPLGWHQRAKKVAFNSPGLVDFSMGLVNPVFNLPDGQVMFFWGIWITEELWNQYIILLVKKLSGLVEMTSGLVSASFSLPEWQAVKMIFFAPWARTYIAYIREYPPPPHTHTPSDFQIIPKTFQWLPNNSEESQSSSDNFQGLPTIEVQSIKSWDHLCEITQLSWQYHRVKVSADLAKNEPLYSRLLMSLQDN